MTFDQAVAHVRAAATASVAAYAFVPTMRRGATAGGTIWAVAFDADAPPDADPVVVDLLAGIFGSGASEVDAFAPDDAPDEALDLAYEVTTSYDAEILDYDPEVALAVLRGATLDDALAALDAAGPPTGPNATPEARTADLLLGHGMPAVLATTPAGPLPAVVVLLDDDDPRLGALVDLFGGVVVAGTGDAGRAPAPAAAGTNGRGAPAADEADGDDAREADDAADDEAEPREAAWVGVGRGAVLATVLAVRALPEWGEEEIPDDLAEGWRTLLAYAATAAAAPPDASGRRPKPVYQELRRLAAKVERLVARQIAGHEPLLALLGAAVARELADGTFVAADLALPTVRELEDFSLEGSGS